MTSSLLTFIGALCVTFVVARLASRLTGGLRYPASVAIAHVLSLIAIAGVIVAIKSYFTLFPIGQVMVYVVPQAIWLVYDLIRKRP